MYQLPRAPTAHQILAKSKKIRGGVCDLNMWNLWAALSLIGNGFSQFQALLDVIMHQPACQISTPPGNAYSCILDDSTNILGPFLRRYYFVATIYHSRKEQTTSNLGRK